MGDRTTLQIEILKSDREAVVNLLGNPVEEYPDTSGPATTSLFFHEMNYGGGDLLAALATAAIAFSARHDEGCDYYGMTLAACDGTLVQAASPHGDLMIHVDADTLEPAAGEIDNLRRWRATEDRVRALFVAAAATSTA
jgi:hypothetical protein